MSVSITKPSEPGPLKPWLKILVSLLLLTHLTVVIAAPAAMVPPRSRLAREIVQLAAPYLEAGNVSHGYAFFAPDPGPSHLIRYVLYWDDGDNPRELKGKFPDIDRHWPRLRYHRHFMLTDQLASVAMGPEKPPRLSDDPEYVRIWKDEVEVWKQARARFFEFMRSYAQHLISVHQADRVDLYYVQHNIPRLEDVLAGQPLSHESLFVNLPSEHPDAPTFTYEVED